MTVSCGPGPDSVYSASGGKIYTMGIGSRQKPGNISMKIQSGTHWGSPVSDPGSGGHCDPTHPPTVLGEVFFLKGNGWAQRQGQAPHFLKTWISFHFFSSHLKVENAPQSNGRSIIHGHIKLMLV